jgi:hypothetical protein
LLDGIEARGQIFVHLDGAQRTSVHRRANSPISSTGCVNRAIARAKSPAEIRGQGSSSDAPRPSGEGLG